MGRPRCAPRHVGMLFCLLSSACAANGRVDFEYREVEHTFSRAERHTIERIAEDTVAEVRQLLPAVPDRLVLRVDADDNVSEVTFATASAVVPNRLYWSVDPERGDGVAATAETHLRPMLFHGAASSRPIHAARAHFPDGRGDQRRHGCPDSIDQSGAVAVPASGRPTVDRVQSRHLSGGSGHERVGVVIGRTRRDGHSGSGAACWIRLWRAATVRAGSPEITGCRWRHRTTSHT